MNNHIENIKYLIDEVGTNIIDNVDEDGHTALHIAIIWGRNSVVVYLLSTFFDKISN